MDTQMRSVVKGLTWRAFAMLDTVLLALIFTGSISTALSIGGLELITKVVWYYLHERLWVVIPSSHDTMPWVERWLGHHGQSRSLIKALSWRFFGAIDTFAIAFILTGHIGVSGAIGGAELFTKVALYYLHERMWHYVPWGRTHEESKGPLASFVRLYHIGAAGLYALACVMFVLVSASFIYIVHSAYPSISDDQLIQTVSPEI